MREILCEAAITCKASEYLGEISRLQSEIAELKASAKCSVCGGTDSVCGKAWTEERLKLEKSLAEAQADLKNEMAYSNKRDSELAEVRDLLAEIKDEIAGYVDGSPDASTISKWANNLTRDIEKILTRPPASSESGERAKESVGVFDLEKAKQLLEKLKQPAAREWVEKVRDELEYLYTITLLKRVVEPKELGERILGIIKLLPPTDPAKGG